MNAVSFVCASMSRRRKRGSFPYNAGKQKASNLFFFLPGHSLSHPPPIHKAKPLRGAWQPCGFLQGAIPSGHQKKEKFSRGATKNTPKGGNHHEEGH